MGKKRKRRERTPPELEWRESRTARRLDELRKGEQALATLHWKSVFSTLATGAMQTYRWTFERPRILSRDIEVREPGTERLVALFAPGWTNEGTLTLPDGRTFHWRAENFWRTRWSFTTDAGQPLVRFVDTSGFLERRTAVEFAQSERTASGDALLILLGRYLMVLQAQDAAAATAATTVVVT
jgi:hypothetical protein